MTIVLAHVLLNFHPVLLLNCRIECPLGEVIKVNSASYAPDPCPSDRCQKVSCINILLLACLKLYPYI